MKYCITTTQNHPIAISFPNCVEEINSLLKNEGHIVTEDFFIKSETVLNLDKAEALNAIITGRSEKNKSMDFSFGISNDEKSFQLMVIVEARLNYMNPNNVNREALEEKVTGSKSILTDAIPIYANYIFLFRSDKKEEAKSRFFRMNPKIPNEYLVMDVGELWLTFFTN